jgi:hypothetical protein
MVEQREPVFGVVEPVGPQRVDRLTPAAGIPDLRGRRIGYLWDSLFSGDVLYGVISEELAGRHDGITFVGHEVFGDIHGHAEREVIDELPDRLRREGVDAVVAGIGA